MVVFREIFDVNFFIFTIKGWIIFFFLVNEVRIEVV